MDRDVESCAPRGSASLKLKALEPHLGKTFREVAEMRPYVDWCKQKIADAYYAREFFRYIAAKEAPSSRTTLPQATFTNCRVGFIYP